MSNASTIVGKPKRTFAVPINIEVNEAYDIPVLLEIRNATFISRRQLQGRFAKVKHWTVHDALASRLRKFVSAGFLNSGPRVLPYIGPTYSVTREGLRILETFGYGLASITSGSKHLADEIQAAHCLELNDIRDTFRGACETRWWYSDREVSSINCGPVNLRFAKNYDAAAEIVSEQSRFKIGIENERTIKSDDLYQEIAAKLKQEKLLLAIIYFVASDALKYKLACAIRCEPMPVCFVGLNQFRRQALAAPVAFVKDKEYIVSHTLKSFLDSVKPVAELKLEAVEEIAELAKQMKDLGLILED